MARYMVQASYSGGAISDLVKDPQDRAAVIRKLIEGMGGKMESFDYCFGDYDVVVIAELPDNVSVAAVSMAVGASGTCKEFKTTVLLSMQEALEAMKKAGGVGYRPPGG